MALLSNPIDILYHIKYIINRKYYMGKMGIYVRTSVEKENLEEGGNRAE